MAASFVTPQQLICRANTSPAASPARQLIILEHLPREALEIVLPFLDPRALVHLHVATAKGIAALRQRSNATRCACRWLQLTRWVPPLISPAAFAAFRSEQAARSLEYAARDAADALRWEVSKAASYPGTSQVTPEAADVNAVPTDYAEEEKVELSAASCAGSSVCASSSDSGWSDQPLYEKLATKQVSWRPCSKHSVLSILHDQIQHVNGIAALMFTWTASVHDYLSELHALGLQDQLYKTDSGLKYRDRQETVERFHNLKAAIKQAFLLGWDAHKKCDKLSLFQYKKLGVSV